jgi:CMP-N,N'-diacetyllegionaminic acid synthase
VYRSESGNLNLYMKKKPFVLAITPARGGSKGVPRKNIIDLGGKPLIAHTIQHAQACDLIDQHIVSSEDDEIRAVAEDWGAQTMTRPAKYAHDQILQEVDLLLQWTVERFEKQTLGRAVDIVVLLYPTAPLRDVKSITNAINLVSKEGYDSALSVYFDTRYLWELSEDRQSICPKNYDPNNRMPRQKEVWNQWAENKAIYVMRRNVLFEGSRIGQKCGYVEMEKWRSVDIDNLVDLEMARAIYSANKKILDS